MPATAPDSPRWRVVGVRRAVPWVVLVGVPSLLLVLLHEPGMFWLRPERFPPAPASAGWGLLFAVGALAVLMVAAGVSLVAAACSGYARAAGRVTVVAAVCLGLGLVAARPSVFPVPGAYRLARAAARVVSSESAEATTPYHAAHAWSSSGRPHLEPADPSHPWWTGRPSSEAMGRRAAAFRRAAPLAALWLVNLAFSVGLLQGLRGPGRREPADAVAPPEHASEPREAPPGAPDTTLRGREARGWGLVVRIVVAVIAIVMVGAAFTLSLVVGRAYGAPAVYEDAGTPEVVPSPAVSAAAAEAAHVETMQAWHRDHRTYRSYGAGSACDSEDAVGGSRAGPPGIRPREVHLVGAPESRLRAAHWGERLRFEAEFPAWMSLAHVARTATTGTPGARGAAPLAWHVTHGTVTASGVDDNVAWAEVNIAPGDGIQDGWCELEELGYHPVDVFLTLATAAGPMDAARWCLAAGERIPFGEALRRCLPSSAGDPASDHDTLALIPEVARARLAHVGEIPIADRRAALQCFQRLRGRETLHPDHADYVAAYRLLEKRAYPPGPEPRWLPQSAVEARILFRAGIGRLLLGLGLVGFTWAFGFVLGKGLRGRG